MSTAKTDNTDSNETLLGRDATAAISRTALGIALLSSPAVTQRALWLVPRDRVFVVLRTGAQVAADASAAFSSNRTAIRCALSVGFGFPHEAAVFKIHMEAAS